MALFHVWFATKNRKWLLQGDIVEAAKDTLRSVAKEKGYRLVEVEAVVDHVHLMLDLDDKSQLPWAMNLLKGVSARRLFVQFPDVKLDAHTNSFWQAGYAAKLVPPGAGSSVREYIRTQWECLDDYVR